MLSRFLASLKAKLLFLVSLVLVVAFTFLISYFLDKAISFEDTKYFGEFFMWVRCIIAAMMLGAGLYFVLSSKDISGKIYFLISTAILQILPFFIRLVGLIDNEKTAVEISILILAVVGIPYLLFVFYLVIATDQMKIARRKTKAEVTKAVNEDKYYDKNGNFIGNGKNK